MRPTAFDYVIVGGGVAGCVLANRLSASNASVLLLEAGAEAVGPFRNMPIAARLYFYRPDMNWSFRSEPEANLGNRVLDLPRGKTLGGCSAINGITFAIGHRNDYVDWGEIAGDEWGPERMQAALVRALGQQTNGELARSETPSVIGSAIERGAAAAGFPSRRDDFDAEGYTPTQLMTRAGRRLSAARGFLEPVRRRRNLVVWKNAQVTKVLMEAGRATGVSIMQGGERFSVSANAEVILCAGAYGSPHLLMLSGIGRGEHLRGHGVEVEVDAPMVGENLLEHPLTPLSFLAPPVTFVNELRWDRAVLSVLRWAALGSGPFSTNGSAGSIFIKTDSDWNRPDIQLMCSSLGRDSQLWSPWQTPVHALSALVSMIRSDSKGSVKLASADPARAPAISLNLFAEESDMRRMLRGIKAARAIFARIVLDGAHLTETGPGAACRDDSELEALVREVAVISHHPVGTCRMGRDNYSVVDERLNVRGVSALRVVDASVMPTIPGGNTNVPTVMVAERASDLIIEDRAKRRA